MSKITMTDFAIALAIKSLLRSMTIKKIAQRTECTVQWLNKKLELLDE